MVLLYFLKAGFKFCRLKKWHLPLKFKGNIKGKYNYFFFVEQS